jgi:hypothetical protein
MVGQDSSPLTRQRADVLRRARKLPIGSDRNDLRQLALGLRYLEKKGFEARIRDRTAALGTLKAGQRQAPDPLPSSLVYCDRTVS